MLRYRILKFLAVGAFSSLLAGCPPFPPPQENFFIAVNITDTPATDPGRFQLVANPGTSTQVNLGGNLHAGTTVPATPVLTATNTLVLQPWDTSTNLANYTVVFDQACSASGVVTVPFNTTATCTLTITRKAPQGPPAPVFSMPGGTGACPYSVSLSDSDASARIFFTTDLSQPTQGSPQATGPIMVSASETITAIAINANGSSPTVAQTYTCGGFTSVDLIIQTGSDDARTDSAIQATLVTSGPATTVTFCLKNSDNGATAICPKMKGSPTWQPSSFNTITFGVGSTNVPSVSGFSSLNISLMEFPGTFKSDDNWDLQSLTMVAHVAGASPGFPSAATVLSVAGSTPVGSGSCFARYKHPHGAKLASVVFNFVGGPVTVLDDDGPHTAPYCKE